MSYPEWLKGYLSEVYYISDEKEKRDGQLYKNECVE